MHEIFQLVDYDLKLEVWNLLSSLHKKWSLPLRVYSVNVTKSVNFLWIWSHLLKKPLTENFIFCAVRGILISPKLLAIFDTKVSFFQLNENGMTDRFLNTLKGNVRNFQKLEKRKYLIKYYITKKRFCLKIHFFKFSVNLIFVVLHLKNRPSCSFR